MKAVLDTNVLISGVIATGAPHEVLVAEFVDPDEDIDAVEPDPDDDKFLEAATAGEVDFVASGDAHLLDLGSFRGIEIVDPRTFYERLDLGEG